MAKKNKKWCVCVEYVGDGDNTEFNKRLVEAVGIKPDEAPEDYSNHEWSCAAREQAEKVADLAYNFFLGECVARGRREGTTFTVSQTYNP